MTLGLMPKERENKIAIMDMISDACAAVSLPFKPPTRRFGGLSLALMALCREENQQGMSWIRNVNCTSMSWLHTQMTTDQRIDFTEFLKLLSKVRAWHQGAGRQECAPLFQRRLRRPIDA